MDGSSVIFIVLPIVIPLVLFAGIALPHLAKRRKVTAPSVGPVTARTADPERRLVP